MNQLTPVGINDPALFWTIAFGLIGVVGAGVGLLSWWDSRRTKRVNSYILEIAERNLDKSLTEKELHAKKAEVEAVNKQMQELQEQIKRDIPIQARRAVLLDRLNLQVELLRRYLRATQQLQAELAVLGETPPVPPDLLRAVEAEISPEYVLRERRSTLKTQLTIITSAAAIISTLLPAPWDRFLSWPLLVAAIPVIILLARVSLPGTTAVRKRAMQSALALALVGTAVLGCALGILLIVVGTQSEAAPDAAAFGGVLLFLAVFLGVFGARMYTRNRDIGRQHLRPPA